MVFVINRLPINKCYPKIPMWMDIPQLQLQSFQTTFPRKQVDARESSAVAGLVEGGA
jgi:hypothetical protein